MMVIQQHKEDKMINTYTTIRIHKATQKQLQAIGNKGQSYEDIISKLIRMYIQQTQAKGDIT